MRRTLSVLSAAALAAGMLLAWAAVASAGFNPIITGVATCNTTTGQYDIAWTMTDVQSAGPFGLTNPGIVTETPGGATSNVTFSPTTVPLNGTSTASGPVSGTTTTAAIDIFANGAPRHFTISAAQGLHGTCVLPSSGGGPTPVADATQTVDAPVSAPIAAGPRTVG